MTGPAPAAGRPARSRHSARHDKHARSSEARHGHRPPLSIRSAEGRCWSADLSGPGPACLVVHGAGGIGKSTLAMQIAARVVRLQSGRISASLRGELSAGSFATGSAGADFVVWDDFDDNLARNGGQWFVRDAELAAALTRWTGKLLIVSGRSFTLTPVPAAPVAGPVLVPPRPPSYPAGLTKLVVRGLGPLTRSGSGELTSVLPAIRLLDDTERDRVWRLTAGHPRATEYLDSLLATGERFPEVARRIEAMVVARTGQPLPRTGQPLLRTGPTGLPEALAEAIASAAGEQLFGELYDRLSAGARMLLVRASVFRVPVPDDALAAKPGQLAECELAGLLTSSGAAAELAVSRWTSGQLHRRLAEASHGNQVAAAPWQAAAYWLGRAADAPCPRHTSLPPRSRPRPRLACDPAMCSALPRYGVPAGDLLVVGPGTSDPLGSDVVVATVAVRSLFGTRLTTVYAPDVLASFGSGSTRIDIRVVAADGATAYADALAADRRARQAAGQQLIGNLRIGITAAARSQHAAGAVDARLLMTLALLGGSESNRIAGFSDDGPGASPGMPLRQVTLTASTAGARAILAFYQAQREPYLPDRTVLTPGPGGQAVLTVQFAAPCPLGLLQPQA